MVVRNSITRKSTPFVTDSKRLAHKNVVQMILKAEPIASAAVSAEKNHERTS